MSNPAPDIIAYQGKVITVGVYNSVLHCTYIISRTLPQMQSSNTNQTITVNKKGVTMPPSHGTTAAGEPFLCQQSPQPCTSIKPLLSSRAGSPDPSDRTRQWNAASRLHAWRTRA